MNRAEARDAIFAVGTIAWNEAILQTAIAPSALRYQDGKDAEPEQGTTWARLSMQTVNEYQETLRNNVKRYVTAGIFYTQIFVPRSGDQARVDADALAESIRNYFRGFQTADGILEFTAAMIDDNVRPEPAWLAVNVTVRYWYRQFL